MFSNTSMRDKGLEMLCKGMAESSTKATHSGEIEGDFSGNHITSEGLKWFLDIPIHIFLNIKKLDFSRNELDGPALNTFCGAIPDLSNLQTLHLASNPIGESGAVQVLKCLHHYSTPLKELDIHDTGVGEEDCAQLALLTDLELLDISDNNLTSKSVASIIESKLRNSIIKKVNMSYSKLSEENCISLSSLLQQPVCQLRELDIRKCGINDKGAVHLGTALTKNLSLTTLNIMQNPIGDVGAAALGAMINDNKVLENISMHDCGITPAGFVQLARGLIGCSLKTLWLGGNQCGVEGARAISSILKKNKTLQELRLNGDASLEEGVCVIMDSLQYNSTLRVIWLSKQYQQYPADPRVKWGLI